MRESPRETVLLPQLGARPMGSLAASLTATLSIGLGGSLCLTNSLPAQCGTEWVAVAGVPGTEHWAYCSTAWDPDGPGPRTPVLILGGMFQTAGGIRAEHIAMFDPATGSWSPLDAGLTGASTGFMATYALLTLPNGDLVAGGNFALAGSTAASNIARWDGTSWKPFGSGMNGAVSALCVAPNGDLLAGGGFTLAGGVSAQGIARWDGASWHAFGSGTNSTVTAIAVVPNGDVVAGGWFTSAGGTPANYIARWDGAAWHALGAGLAQTAAPPVSSLAVLPTGDLAVGGAFNFAGNLLSPCLALWTGTSWSAFGSGADSTVDALALSPNGDLLAAGRFFHVDGVPASGVARWDGSTWSALGAGLGPLEVYTVAGFPGGEVYAGGDFRFTGAGAPAWNVARWDGVTWDALTRGNNGPVYALAKRAHGGVIAGGQFNMVAGVSANGVAVSDGSSWSGLGSGLASPTNAAAVAETPAGDVIAAGAFATAGGIAAKNIARWDGAVWHALGPGLDRPGGGGVEACISHTSGDIFAGGYFLNAGSIAVNGVARWDGSAWHALGSGVSGFTGRVRCLVELPNGDVVAGGAFFSAGGVSANFIARWDGSSWHALGAGVNSQVDDMVVLPNGDLLVAGGFTTAGGTPANRIARWDGTSWHPLGSGTNRAVHALEVLPNGDVIAGGEFTMAGGAPAFGIARWDGSAWSAIPGGVTNTVWALALRDDGVLEVGGDFQLAGGLATAFVAEWRTTCPATTVEIPTTCMGSVGALTLTATSQPWVGATFESAASGFAPGALAASVFGLLSPNTPLSAWTPLAGPGCFQFASLEAIALVVPQSGEAADLIQIPNSANHAGLVLFHQFLQLELGGPLQPALVSSSNGLRLAVGGF